GEVAAVAGQILHPPRVEPRALEDRLALELVERGRGRVLERDGRCAELRVVPGPRSLGRSPEAIHCRALHLPTRARGGWDWHSHPGRVWLQIVKVCLLILPARL